MPAFSQQCIGSGTTGKDCHYRARRAGPDDVPLIARGYAAQEPVPPRLQQRLPELLRQLFARRLLLGGVVERCQEQAGRWQLAAYGMVGFLAPQFFERHLRDPHPFLGIHVLQRAAAGDVRGVLLAPQELCRLNAAPEPALTMFVLCWHQDNYDFTSPDGQKLLQGAFRLMERYLSGYNLGNLIFEGRAAYRHVSEKVGFSRMIDFSDDDRPQFAHLRADPRYQPHLHGIFMRPEGPLIPGAPITQLFTYKPPLLLFSDAQKEVLELALEGHCDDEIAHITGASRNAIQMRWRKIYMRFEQHLPGFFGTIAERVAPRARGPEKRRQVLQYLRQHPEELRPYCPRRKRAATRPRN